MRCVRIMTKRGAVWRLIDGTVIYTGRTISEAVARYQAHSRAQRGGAA